MCSNESTKSRIQPTLLNLQLMMTIIKQHNKTIITKVMRGILMISLSMMRSWKLLKLKIKSSSINLLISEQTDLQLFTDPSGVACCLSNGRGGATISLRYRWMLVNCCVALPNWSFFLPMLICGTIQSYILPDYSLSLSLLCSSN